MRIKYLYNIFIFFLLTLSFSTSAFATHIIGGELYYDWLGNYNYKITLKLYRDCNSSTPYDADASIGIFDTSGTLVNTMSLPLPTPTNIPVVLNNPCVDPPSGICVQEAVYSGVIHLPPIAGGYKIAYQRCCRNGGIVNIVNPADAGLTCLATIPDTSVVDSNSSPRFNNFPPVAICQGLPLDFDHSATDPDGDSLVYSFFQPYTGATTANPAPVPPNAPPYTPILWSGGYSTTYQIDGSPAFAINPSTGMLTGTPTQLGRYVIGICVKEYRNGVFLSQTNRDFQFNVSACNIHVVAAIASQTVFCDGKTVEFHNQSVGGVHYHWDFDDPASGAANDTSDLANPSHLYSDTGVYTVTLVAISNTGCTDTTHSTFSVHDSFYAAFTPPPIGCDIGQGLNFEAGGDFDTSLASFSWHFGQYANPDSSNLQNPQNIKFDSVGTWPVTFTISQTGCSKSYTDSVKIEAPPVFGIKVGPDTGCAVWGLQFTDTSQSAAPMVRLWDFGDGDTSSAASLFHYYQQGGNYTATVMIYSTEGCIDTAYFADTIIVYPKPQASFEVYPSEQNIFTPTFQITDLANNIVGCSFNFEDGYIDSLCLPSQSHTYADTGYHSIVQMVVNQYGCKDTTIRTIYVKPVYTFYIPNSFTPDGDGLNEVFKPKMEAVRTYQFYIFNRWGQIIFKTQNQNEGWDGDDGSGKMAPVGVYVYLVKLRDIFGIDHQYVGHVTLVR